MTRRDRLSRAATLLAARMHETPTTVMLSGLVAWSLGANDRPLDFDVSTPAFGRMWGSPELVMDRLVVAHACGAGDQERALAEVDARLRARPDSETAQAVEMTIADAGLLDLVATMRSFPKLQLAGPRLGHVIARDRPERVHELLHNLRAHDATYGSALAEARLVRFDAGETDALRAEWDAFDESSGSASILEAWLTAQLRLESRRGGDLEDVADTLAEQSSNLGWRSFALAAQAVFARWDDVHAAMDYIDDCADEDAEWAYWYACAAARGTPLHPARRAEVLASAPEDRDVAQFLALAAIRLADPELLHRVLARGRFEPPVGDWPLHSGTAHLFGTLARDAAERNPWWRDAVTQVLPTTGTDGSRAHFELLANLPDAGPRLEFGRVP